MTALKDGAGEGAEAGEAAGAGGDLLAPHARIQDKDCDLDSVLSAAGEFGRYQRVLVVAMVPAALFFAVLLFVQMFVVAAPQQYWCRVPELDNYTETESRALSIPREGAGFSRCREYAVDWAALLPAPGAHGALPAVNTSWPTRRCRHGWRFNRTDIPYATITTELEWVCERDSYATIAQVGFFLGSVVGGVLFGWTADKYGRVPALIGANAIGCAGGVATIFSTDIVSFSLCRFVVGLSYDNAFMMVYIIVLEYVGAAYRTRVANLSIAIFFGLGCVSLPWLALWIADWRALLLATSLPMVLIIAAAFLMPESIRWLLHQGRVDQVTQILQKIARVNGRVIPDKLLLDFQESAQAMARRRSRARADGGGGGGVRAMLRRPPLRRLLLSLVLVYMACALVFDALVRLSDSLGLDFFLTFTLTSATEMPSVVLLTLLLDRWGRRNLAAGPMLLSALFCALAALAPSGLPSVCLAITARFFINMSYNCALQWGTELLPTGARAGGTSAVHILGYVATALSPCVLYLGNYVSWLPLWSLVAAGMGGGLLSLLLPETRGAALPQTFADAEHLYATASLFNKRRKRTGSEEGRELAVLGGGGGGAGGEDVE